MYYILIIGPLYLSKNWCLVTWVFGHYIPQILLYLNIIAWIPTMYAICMSITNNLMVSFLVFPYSFWNLQTVLLKQSFQKTFFYLKISGLDT